MKKITFMLFFLLITTNLFAAEAGELVSIIELVSNPQNFDGRKVTIVGFLNLEFEGNAIYLHKNDYEYSIYKNGIWCDIDVAKYSKFNKKHVWLEGTFNTKSKGHMGLWSGSIEKITRVWESERSRILK